MAVAWDLVLMREGELADWVSEDLVCPVSSLVYLDRWLIIILGY